MLRKRCLSNKPSLIKCVHARSPNSPSSKLLPITGCANPVIKVQFTYVHLLLVINSPISGAGYFPSDANIQRTTPCTETEEVDTMIAVEVRQANASSGFLVRGATWG